MLIASMLPLRMLGLLVLMFSLCDADSGCSRELTLDPPEVLAEYGESVIVNCSSAENDYERFYWRVGSTEFPVENSVPMSFNLTDWNVTVECILSKQNDTECRKELTITLYKNPDSVIMFPTKYEAAVEGRPYELQCDVIDVAPVQHLTVRWYRGNDTIRTDYFTQPNKTKRLVSESFTLAANFSRGENGAQVRCEAQLDFGQHGSQPVNSNIHTVSVHYAPELKNKTEDVYVNEGDHVTLNCEAEGNPAPAFHWSLDGVNLMKSTDYLNITRATSAIYNCTATNYLGNATKQIHVHVMKMNRMGAPAAITTPEPSTQTSCPLVLTPAEIVVRFGDPVSVNCSTSVTGVFQMGWEATSGSKATSDNATTWKVEKVEEWVAKPLCYITLNDYQCSVMLDITVYKTPDNVSVSALDQRPMVEGTEYRLKCDITNVAPVKKLKLTWYRGNETVHTEMFNGTAETPVNVSSTLRVTPERDHNGALFRCEAELHLGQNGSDLGPTVTSSQYMAVVHYAPVFNGSYSKEVNVILGDNVTFDCSADGNPPPEIKWSYGSKANVTVTTRGRQKSIIVTGATSTDAGDYDCVATNEIDVMRRTVTLVVQDRPEPRAAGFIWWLLILLVIVLILILIIIIFAHRWTKKGQYTFVSDKASDQDSSIPMTPQSNGV
ncbi:intercellular adhesion molecule 5 [Cebidichthys violaceus]|uniref:intercellular adhesion molecule 5 n=1 Tax=Cebidichthys violaceus TaxID=271503 RepID=UPI0035CB03D3